MNNNLSFDFSVNRENNTITVKREFEADINMVWDAYTKSEILDLWWAPKPWKAKTKTMDFRDGGHWHYAMVGPEGEEHWAWAEYKNIQAQLPSGQRKFTGLDAFADAEGNINQSLPQSEWQITFTPKGNLTIVECFITFSDLSQLETTLQMGFKDGMRIAMEGLDEIFASQL
ncbi:MAG: SRPBCC domain-containing protein [Bacteroidota bacterium]